MPLTSAEKSKRYREKLKFTNPEKYVKTKKKAIERALKAYRRKIADRTAEQKELRTKWRPQNKINKNNRHNQQDIEQPQELVTPSTSQNDIPIRNISFNRTIERTTHTYIQRNLENENTKLRIDIQNLKKRFNSLQKQMRIQQQELVKINQNYEKIMVKLQESPARVIKIKTSVELVNEDPLLCMSSIKEENFVDQIRIETLQKERGDFEHDVTEELVA